MLPAEDHPKPAPDGDRTRPRRRRRPALTAAISVLSLAVSIAAIGLAIHAESGRVSAAPVPNLGIVERDFTIQAPVAAVRPGLVDFTVTNAGASPHELLIFRASQPPDQLPTGADGRVQEDSDQITKVFDSGDNIAPNTSRVFHTALVPGTYVMVCNLPGHYRAGMHATLTVNGTNSGQAAVTEGRPPTTKEARG